MTGVFDGIEKIRHPEEQSPGRVSKDASSPSSDISGDIFVPWKPFRMGAAADATVQRATVAAARGGDA
jgi:hypothetical protein